FHDAHIAWVFLPWIAFGVAVSFHLQARAAQERAGDLAGHYEAGLARLDYRVEGDGHTDGAYSVVAHRYSAHLDLFGARSLFARLSFARTRSGRDTLAGWLLEPADAATIRARHAAIDATRESLDLREDLASIDDEEAAAIDDEWRLAEWATAPVRNQPRALAAGLSVATVLALCGLKWLGAWPLLVVLCAQGAFAWSWRKRVHDIVEDARNPARELALAAHVLARLEKETFHDGILGDLHASWTPDEGAASERLAHFVALIDRHDWRANQMFALIAPLVMWSTQCAFALEAWRARWGASVPAWLKSIGACEALLDLSRYGFENPDDTFPVLVDDAVFAAEGLAHPLLPPDQAIRNEFAVGAGTRLWIVTGSNMSGKSTLLRSVGVNAVLAMAGAPVRAHSLKIGPLAIGASIRTIDSLQEGASRFYAEVSAIQRVVQATDGGRTVLFLLDELLHGTNSHDRRVGAAGLLKGLLTRGAIGIVTTHDLALAQLEQEIGRHVGNAHFECELRDAELHFDYRLQPGVVESSNALELMRAVGLDV
ncbi:MAG: DNA mismatch repair protein MutS, partial [Planctomycetota bacterium]|nr:DNA mismatch repair protein MutS [Planctomycetota bacterium]